MYDHLIVGAIRGPTRAGHTRRASSVWQVADAFRALLGALDSSWLAAQPIVHMGRRQIIAYEVLP